MGKYGPLADHLMQRKHGHWVASFTQIEAVLGFALPRSARRYPAWWANQSNKAHVQATAWRGVGWRTACLDLEREQVEFRRGTGAPESLFGDPEPDRVLLDQVKAMIGVRDDEAAVRHALKAVIEGAAAARLSALGGKMQRFLAPSRRRPKA